MKSVLALILAALTSGCGSLLSTERASLPSIVTVATNTGHGTGFPITSHCVVTAAHVVAGDEDSVRITGADNVDHQVKVLRQDADIDVAVVCSPDMWLTPARLAAAMPEVYSQVYIIGDPLAFSRVLTEGRYQGGTTVTAQVAPGNSGGPVFDEHGDVIGLADALAAYNTPAGIMGFSHLATIVPVTTIRAYIRDLLA